MAQADSGGEPFDGLDGDTPPAEALAGWLRDLTTGLSLRELAKRFRYGHTRWGDFRSGHRLIPSWLLEELVTALVKDPVKRHLALVRGQELLAAAEEAALAATAAPPTAATDSAAEIQLRLDDARQGQLQAVQMVHDTTRIIFMLLTAVATLGERCRHLEDQRDRAATGTHDQRELTAVQAELADTRQRLEHSETLLAKARHERDQAEQLRIEAQQLAAAHYRAWQNRRLPRDPHPHDDTTTTGTATPDDTSPPTPPLWQYDHLLETADAELDAHATNLAALRRRMGLPDAADPVSPAAGSGVVPGRVVRVDSVDTSVGFADSDGILGPGPETAVTLSGVRTPDVARRPEVRALAEQRAGEAAVTAARSEPSATPHSPPPGLAVVSGPVASDGARERRPRRAVITGILGLLAGIGLISYAFTAFARGTAADPATKTLSGTGTAMVATGVLVCVIGMGFLLSALIDRYGDLQASDSEDVPYWTGI
ncbi:hypothetical protein OG871_39105 [Kitasatospora sp. NBC_00374]|uniref:hypothetical protein n=1 Tax=Kitasatospora sp. NBC_00374 TaxID=2975964 RepID=UPI00325503EA